LGKREIKISWRNNRDFLKSRRANRELLGLLRPIDADAVRAYEVTQRSCLDDLEEPRFSLALFWILRYIITPKDDTNGSPEGRSFRTASPLFRVRT
jgi:hypothetical protein